MFLSQEKQPGILYLKRNGFYLFVTGMTNFVEFPFSPSVSRDLEIINKDILISQIHIFLDRNKIPQASIFVVLNESVYFSKDLPENQAYDRNNIATQQFLENVPFDSFTYKLYNLSKKVRIIAGNQEFFETIDNAFELKNSTIETIIPEFLLENKFSFQNGIDVSNIKMLLSTTDSLKHFSLPLTISKIKKSKEDKKDKSNTHAQEQDKSGNDNSDRKRLIALVSVFFILMAILGFVLYSSQKTNVTTEKKSKILSQPTKIPTLLPNNQISPGIYNQKTPETSPSSERNNLKVQIVSSPSNQNQSIILQNNLSSLGSINIEAQQNDNINTSQTQLIFSNNISNALRDKIVQSIFENINDFTVQETASSSYDLIIIIGNR